MMNPDTQLAADADQLAPNEWARLERVANGLWTAMRGVVDSWPLDARSATAMSRRTGCERTTAQRVIQTAARPVPSVELLEFVPGPRAMRAFLDQLRDVPALPGGAIEPLARAVDAFDVAIRELAGTQRGVARRIQASSGVRGASSTPDQDDDAMRRVLFEAAEHFLGRSTSCLSLVYVAAPSGDRPDRIIYYKALALSGHRSSSQSIPLVLDYFGNTDHDAAGPTLPPPRLMPAFTSPVVVPQRTYAEPTERPYATLRLDLSAIDGPIDCAVLQAQDAPHPTTLDPPVEEVFHIFTIPAAALVFDVYLHRSLAERCLPSVDIHLVRPDFVAFPHGRPDTRLQRPLTLTDLGRGLQRSDSPLNTRHREFAETVFGDVGEDPLAYIGFRCEQRHPIWRTGYRMAFDFSTRPV